MNQNQDTPVLVSIHCLAYNQASFIRQCLEGFINQKTNFHFEAIVHDDASTDSTAEIIKEYAKKYPDIIKPILEKENQFSKHADIDGLMRKNTRGKYIALCEGDDYWTDPHKLQKQVDFMECHLDYSMCFHAADLFNENALKTSFQGIEVENRDYGIDELWEGWIVPTASILYRTSVNEKFSIVDPRIITSDKILILECASVGKVRGFSDKMSVYRIHQGGITQDYNKRKERVIAKPYYLEYILMHFHLSSTNKIKKELSIAYFDRIRYKRIFSSQWLSDIFNGMRLYPTFPIKYLKSKIMR